MPQTKYLGQNIVEEFYLGERRRLQIYFSRNRNTGEKTFRWRIFSAGNYEIISASSEGFSSEQACRNNLKLTQKAFKALGDVL